MTRDERILELRRQGFSVLDALYIENVMFPEELSLWQRLRGWFLA